jgi:CubicO group peptidase (beta-lactamase class C family)
MIADELERSFYQRADRDAFPGVVLITKGSSQLFAGTYGYASCPWKTPNRLTTRFDTASVTKLFTAVATLQLIDNGLLAFEPASLRSWDCGHRHLSGGQRLSVVDPHLGHRR